MLISISIPGETNEVVSFWYNDKEGELQRDGSYKYTDSLGYEYIDSDNESRTEYIHKSKIKGITITFKKKDGSLVVCRGSSKGEWIWTNLT